ncbi:MAG: glutathione-disulfide reductase [Proteobacteria bacterium]|nr:glutathione-disulfide reductase [Pseudomonadota bacterium]
MIYDYDLLVIGAGSGGVRAARIAAGYNKKVAICESDTVGGTCVIRGCVPKKLLVYASAYKKMFKAAEAFGWSVQSEFDWSKLLANKNAEIQRLNKAYLSLLANAGVDLIMGHGSFIDNHTVKIANKNITAEHIIIATGGTPSYLDIPGIEFAINSNDALDLKSLPDSITINGGGYIAVEFACIFNALGCKVNLVYRKETVLRGFDDEVRLFAQNAFKQAGINVITNTTILAIEKRGNKYFCKTNNGEIQSDVVMFATGRRANTDNLGLKNINIKTADNGTIKVDKEQGTGVQGVYAVGDVCSPYQLTPVAIKEGHLLVNRLFNNEVVYPEYDFVASTVFSQPEIATCGLTEEQARKQYTEIKCYTSTFRAMKYAMSEITEKTLMKLIVNTQNDQVIGCHIVGADAGEIIQGFSVALKNGISKSQLNKTIGIHPTSAEELVTMR